MKLEISIKNEDRRKKSTALLIAAACNLFVEKGYRQTKLDKIAAQASLTKGAVYFYFKDKGDLLKQVLETSLNNIYLPLFQIMKNSDGNALDKYVLFINGMAGAGADPEKVKLLLLPIVISHELNDGECLPAQEILLTLNSLLEKNLIDLFDEGKKSGVFKKSLKSEVQTLLTICLIEGLLIEWNKNTKKIDGEEIARGVRELLLEGVCYPSNESNKQRK